MPGEKGLEARVSLTLSAEVGRRPEYGVTLIRAGDTLHGWRFSAEVLKAAVARFQGAASFVDHVGFFENSASVSDLVGVMDDVAWSDSKRALTGRLALSNTPAAAWVSGLVDQIVEDRGKGLTVPDVGLSADLLSGYYLEGDTRVATEIRSVYSVDVVFYPASGGSFDRVLNSVKGGGDMPGEKERAAAGGGASESEGAGTGETVAVESTQSAQVLGGDSVAVGVERVVESIEAATAVDAAGAKAEELLRAQCATVLDSKLTWSELPQPMKDAVRETFSGKVFAPEALDAEIARYKSMLGNMIAGGVVRGVGEALDGAQTSGMLSSLDRVQLAFERLMGLPIAEEHSEIARLSGIRELYLMMTGDHDFYGQYYPERVRLSNVTTASMTSVVKNVLNKVLLKAYNVRPRWWEPIAYPEDFGTLNQITWMKSGGIGALPTVAEGAAYTELDWSDAEETGDFVKKGGYIGITLEMMDRDNVGAVKRIPREIGNAAWRTLSTLVSDIFTSNAGVGPTMADTNPLFDAGTHFNLLTTALSAGQWDVVVQAVYQQTEPGSGAPLAIRPVYCLVPIELERTAHTIFDQPWSAEATYHHMEVLAGTSKVIVVPEWVDAKDWAAVCDPNDCPGVCIGYRYGREPELFTADDQVVGSMFTNDEMRIKCRFFVAVGVADWRPLHKSNVA